MGIATFAAAQILHALPRVRISRAVGRLCDQPLHPVVSRWVTRAYCHAYRVDLEEATIPTGSAFPSFDAFFTRTLKPGMRRVSSDALVSPSDGELSSVGRVDQAGRIFVKGKPYDVGELVGDPRDAARLHGRRVRRRLPRATRLPSRSRARGRRHQSRARRRGRSLSGERHRRTPRLATFRSKPARRDRHRYRRARARDRGHGGSRHRRAHHRDRSSRSRTCRRASTS